MAAAGEIHDARAETLDARALGRALGNRSVVLVGMMGSGKSTIGRRLADELGLAFVDADHEIEEAANLTIPEIFDVFGEAYFREGERRVIDRLLSQGPQVLATGGGAWMDGRTREAVAEAGVSIWLRADFDVLMERVRRRSGRPLLQAADPEAVMRRLLDEREAVYAQATLTVQSSTAPHDAVVASILAVLSRHLEAEEQEAKRA